MNTKKYLGFFLTLCLLLVFTVQGYTSGIASVNTENSNEDDTEESANGDVGFQLSEATPVSIPTFFDDVTHFDAYVQIVLPSKKEFAPFTLPVSGRSKGTLILFSRIISPNAP